MDLQDIKSFDAELGAELERNPAEFLPLVRVPAPVDAPKPYALCLQCAATLGAPGAEIRAGPLLQCVSGFKAARA